MDDIDDLMGMFSGLSSMFEMAGNYEQRVVSNTEIQRKLGTLVVDTAAVSDSPMPYETAIAYAGYDDGHYIVMECYPTKEDAVAGHQKWVDIMSKDELPPVVADQGMSNITQLASKHGCNLTYELKE